MSTFFDSILGMHPEELNRYDLIFFNSSHWLDVSLEFYRRYFDMIPGSAMERELRGKSFFLGTTQYDHFALTNRTEFRRRLGFSESDKIVTLYMFETRNTFWCERIFHEPSLWRRLLYVIALPFSYPMIKSRLGLRRFPIYVFYSLRDRLTYLWEAFTCPAERDLLLAIRKFCDENGAKLLLKYRRKNPEKAALSVISDAVLKTDDDFYPFTSAEVMNASDLVIVLYSSAVGECVYHGTRVMNIHPSSRFFFFGGSLDFMVKFRPRRFEHALNELYYNQRSGGVYNFPDLVQSFSEREVVRKLPGMKISDFDFSEKARKEYGERFLPPGLSPSAARIADQIEQFIKRKNS